MFKKIINIWLITVFNICLLWVALVVPSLIIASSPSFYYTQFEKLGMYSKTDEYDNDTLRVIPYVDGKKENQAAFTDGQLNAMADHIVRYLFTDFDSFELVMDDVYMVNEGMRDGVSIFGKQAVSHMSDVKGLIGFAKWSATGAGGVIAALLSIFIFKRKRFFKSIFKVSCAFYSALVFFAALFCLWSYIGATKETPFLLNLWGNMHYLLFAFQPEKYTGSFIRDTLTYILPLEFFLNAVIIVIAVIISTVLLWLTAAKLIEKLQERYYMKS